MPCYDIRSCELAFLLRHPDVLGCLSTIDRALMLLKRSIYFLHVNIWHNRGWNDLGFSSRPIFILHPVLLEVQEYQILQRSMYEVIPGLARR